METTKKTLHFTITPDSPNEKPNHEGKFRFTLTWEQDGRKRGQCYFASPHDLIRHWEHDGHTHTWVK